MSNIISTNLRDTQPDISVQNSTARMNVYPRIHMFGLDLSLHSGILRSGSMGFSIPSMPVTIQASPHSKDVFISNYTGGDNKLPNLLAKLRAYLHVTTKWRVTITYPPEFRAHIGIGSSTQVAGGILHCAAASIGRRLNCEDLFSMGMGSASMLGLSLVHTPGFILEYGYLKADTDTPAQRRALQPHLYSGEDIPAYSLLKVIDCPWYAIIGIPRTITSLSGSAEAVFWKKHLPDPPESALSTVYSAFMGCLPALISNNFIQFIASLNAIITQGTKPAEENIQSRVTKRTLRQLRTLFGNATVSSLGPSVYAFSEHDPSKRLAALSSSEYEFIVFPLGLQQHGAAIHE